jgi:hypothetical protein
MKKLSILLFLPVSILCRAQTDSVGGLHTTYERHSIIATASAGIADGYRNNYALPQGFEKNNTSGFAPFFAKLEYGFYDRISLAATLSYDAFYYNYKQEYTGNSGPFTRYRTDDTRIFSGGITAFYHLGNVIRIKHLDPFIGAGLILSNIRYSSFPQDDTTTTKFDHIVSPYLKAGARYYISSSFSLFGDIGYDKQAALSLGFSCRFFRKQKAPNSK